jgi:hypothetical protein
VPLLLQLLLAPLLLLWHVLPWFAAHHSTSQHTISQLKPPPAHADDGWCCALSQRKRCCRKKHRRWHTQSRHVQSQHTGQQMQNAGAVWLHYVMWQRSQKCAGQRQLLCPTPPIGGGRLKRPAHTQLHVSSHSVAMHEASLPSPAYSQGYCSEDNSVCRTKVREPPPFMLLCCAE